MLIAVCRKGLMAGRTLKLIICLAINLIEVGVPPLVPAVRGAEPLLFSAYGLYDGLATVLTEMLVPGRCTRDSHNTAEPIPLAECFDGVLAESEQRCDASITLALFP